MKKFLTLLLTVFLAYLPTFAIDWNSVENIAKDASVTVSSNFSSGNVITDGNDGNRWQAAPTTHQYTNDWILIDLGESKPFTDIEILWEASLASSYSIYTSNQEFEIDDQSSNDPAYKKVNIANLSPAATSTIDSDTNYTDNITFETQQNTRYVLIYCNELNTNGNNYGASIFEVKIGNIEGRNEVTGLSIDPSSVSVIEDESVDITVSPLNAAGENLNYDLISSLSLTCSEEGVIEITNNNNGNFSIKGIKAGNYTLSATALFSNDTVRGEASLTVILGRDKVDRLDVTVASVVEGKDTIITVTPLNAVGDSLLISSVSNLELKCSEPGAVEITSVSDSTFNVKGLTPGEYLLTATAIFDNAQVSGTATFKVEFDWSNVINVATNKTATARIKVSEEAANPASNATDGNLKTYYQYNGDWGGGDAWLIVDLGSEYIISAVGTQYGSIGNGTIKYSFGTADAVLPTEEQADYSSQSSDLFKSDEGWTTTETMSKTANSIKSYIPSTPIKARYVAVRDFDNPQGKPQIVEMYVAGEEYKEAEATDIVINVSPEILFCGEEAEISASIKDQYGIDFNDEPVITVSGASYDNGVLTAGDVAGTITVTATYGSLSETKEIKVVDPASYVMNGTVITADNPDANTANAIDGGSEPTQKGGMVIMAESEATGAHEHWLLAELPKPYNLSVITAIWEGACPRDYDVYVGSDSTALNKVYSVTGHTQQEWNDRFAGQPMDSVKFIKIETHYNATGYGIKLYELKAYGESAVNSVPTEIEISLNQDILFTNETTALSAVVKDQFGAEIETDLSPSFTITGGSYEDGILTVGEQAGSLTITAKYGDLSASKEVTVYDQSTYVMNGAVITTDTDAENPHYVVSGGSDPSANGQTLTISNENAAGAYEHWLLAELARPYNLSVINLIWEGACPRDYDVYVGADTTSLKKVYSVEGHEGMIGWNDRFAGQPMDSVKFIKIETHYNATGYGLKMHELKAYGVQAVESMPSLITLSAVGNHIATDETVTLNAIVYDQFEGEMEDAEVTYFVNDSEMSSNVYEPSATGTFSFTAKVGTLVSEPVKVDVVAVKELNISEPAHTATLDGEVLEQNPFTAEVQTAEGKTLEITFENPYNLDLLRFHWEAACPAAYSVKTENNQGTQQAVLGLTGRSFVAGINPVDRIYNTEEVGETTLEGQNAVSSAPLSDIRKIILTVDSVDHDYPVRLLRIDAFGTVKGEAADTLMVSSATIVEGDSTMISITPYSSNGNPVKLEEISGLKLSSSDPDAVEIGAIENGSFPVKGLKTGTYTLTATAQTEEKEISGYGELIVTFNWTGIENVAEGKSVTGRVNPDNEMENPASNATDGDEETYYQYNGDWAGGDSWVVVDLGEQYVIEAAGASYGDNSNGLVKFSFGGEDAVLPDEDINAQSSEAFNENLGWQTSPSVKRYSNSIATYNPDEALIARYVAVRDFDNPQGKPKLKEVYVSGTKYLNPEASSISLSVSNTIIFTGETTVVSAKVKDQYGVDFDALPQLKISGPATLANDTVTATAPGIVDITATLDTISAKVSLTVYDPETYIMAGAVITTDTEAANPQYAIDGGGNPSANGALLVVSENETAGAHNHWIMATLPRPYDIDVITITWEGACPADYQVLTGENPDSLSLAYNVAGKTTQLNDRFAGENLKRVRYIKILTTANATPYGIKLYEIKAYGTQSEASRTEEIVLESNLTHIALDETVVLTAYVYDQFGGEMTDASVVYFVDGEELEGNSYKPSSSGDYEFTAMTGSLESLPVVVNVVEPNIPTLSSNSYTATLDGVELTTSPFTQETVFEDVNLPLVIELDNAYNLDLLRLRWEAACPSTYTVTAVMMYGQTRTLSSGVTTEKVILDVVDRGFVAGINPVDRIYNSEDEEETIIVGNNAEAGNSLSGVIGLEILPIARDHNYPMRLLGIDLFGKVAATSGVEITTDDSKPVNVYDINGRLLRKDVKPSEALKDLPPAIYIVNGKKVAHLTSQAY